MKHGDDAKMRGHIDVAEATTPLKTRANSDARNPPVLMSRSDVDDPRRLANLHGQVAELLATRILDGTYGPGQALPVEQELSAGFGVSRTTIRGVVKELAGKGLVEVGPSRGTRVRPRRDWNLLDSRVLRWRLRIGVDRKLVRDIYELRECFEPSASRLAAERGDAEQHRLIAQAFEEIVATRSVSDATSVAADVKFHEAILSSSGNEMIVSLTGTLRMALRASFEIARRRQSMSDADIEQHGSVKDAILARSGTRAFKAMAALLDASKQFQMNAAEDP